MYLLLAFWLLASQEPVHTGSEAALRQALQGGGGVIELPAGVTVLHHALEIPRGASGLEIRGHPAGSTLRMAADFKGKAAITAEGASGLRLAGFAITGNRHSLQSQRYLPPSNVAFADFYPGNGVLVAHATGVQIRNLRLRDIRSFAILISASTDVAIDSVTVEDSGTLYSAGRNNTTGGILLEEGTARFSVRRCTLRNILGNGIWTHSNYTSPRNTDGLIASNSITKIARSAIQVGHATGVRVERNQGSRIGYPARYVDLEGYAYAVALDTSGNVDHSIYAGNRFTDINGHCIDLDGFHDGEVLRNSCVNRAPDSAYPYLHFGIFFGNNNPDMTSSGVLVSGNLMQGFAFGGLFLIGSGHRIEDNRFLDLNRRHCTGDPKRPGCNWAPEQPGLLRSGIYLAANGGRPADTHGNIIRNNRLSGFGMDRWCIGAAPGVDLSRNTITGNRCSSTPSGKRTQPPR